MSIKIGYGSKGCYGKVIRLFFRSKLVIRSITFVATYSQFYIVSVFNLTLAPLYFYLTDCYTCSI